MFAELIFFRKDQLHIFHWNLKLYFLLDLFDTNFLKVCQNCTQLTEILGGRNFETNLAEIEPKKFKTMTVKDFGTVAKTTLYMRWQLIHLA